MRVRRIKRPDGKTGWAVLDDNFYQIQPICQYLKYLENLLVIASTESNGDILVLNATEEWLPLTEALKQHPLNTLTQSD